ncbi:hypothetical protein EXIGLDRAFT_616970 [Exidia glandulosa HHB12029]|uniref:2'-phosphotransferase n=1 Tax=Exidia glandulosa HHB12029 TaxID=1314781 RepID=A0A165GER9_EXIGL|nr:hypothetical protein EXIGLDRAFT_616970 [Exidia glandulosa HHB12029]
MDGRLPQGPKPKRENRRPRREDDPRVALSKSMSSVLRHNAEKFGLKMRADGYAKVDDLLALPKFCGQTLESIKAIVDADEKKRYNLVHETDAQSGKAAWFIRANQGHSMQTVKVEMEELTDPARIPMAVHGTTRAAWKSISTQGLSRMNRQHVHLAQGLGGEEGVISGMRKTSTVLVFLDVRKAMAAGLKFYLSENGVVLTPGDANGFVKPEFFSRVEESRTGEVLDRFDGPRAPVENHATAEARLGAGKAVAVEMDEEEAAAEEAWAAIAAKTADLSVDDADARQPKLSDAQ